MKKLFTLLLSVMMMLSLVIPTFAAETGTIEMQNITTDATYEIYKLLDLESYNKESGAYSYKINSSWTDFFKAGTGALDYVAIDSTGYVTWTAAEDEGTVGVFAQLALAYAKDNSIAPVKSSTNPGDFTVVGTTGTFSNLELGYYLIDSTVGALCGLTTTNPKASIIAKNHVPIVEKQVKEDSTGQWGTENTADIGEVVEYRVTVSVHAGAENYVFHDRMSEGLTFNDVTLIQHLVTATNKTNDLVAGTDYTVKVNVSDDDCILASGTCTFEIEFSDEFCKTLETNDKIIIFYNATLNENAKILPQTNPNNGGITYGEENDITWDETETKTHEIDIVKTDSQYNLINGAEFRIYDAETGGKEIKVVKIDEDTYRLAKEGEEGVNIVVDDGKVTVKGFDNGVYYLEEKVAPVGYNKLSSRQRFVIADANLSAVFTSDGIYTTGSGVHVVNKTGNMLPETGGLGTTMFITFGGLAVLGAGVLLFAKKRMTQYSE